MGNAACKIPFQFAPFRLSGIVYGTLLNHASALAQLGSGIAEPPYLAPPRAPVLYIKPRNTLAASGDSVAIPAGIPELEFGACLGLVIGRTACHVTLGEALDHVAGYLIVNDVSVPHAVYYRPAVRLKARDGFCPLGPAVVARDAIGAPDALTIRSYVDGVLVQESRMGECVRSACQLLAEVTEFMTLAAGDVLAMGVAYPAPRVRAGQRVDIGVDGLGTLSNTFVAAAA